MNKRILTIALAGLITLGTTTGIFAAAGVRSDSDASASKITVLGSSSERLSMAINHVITADESIPTIVPTATPTLGPTLVPTMEPTAVPTAVPTVEPTAVPTAVLTVEPTTVPTGVPTVEPTITPTSPPEDVDDDNDETIDPASVLITQEAAKTIALKFAGTTAVFTKIELENEKGVVIYEIKLSSDTFKMEVKIDANTGVILSSTIKDCTDQNTACDQDKICYGNKFGNSEKFYNGNKYGFDMKSCKSNESSKNGEAYCNIESRKNDDTFKDKNQEILESKMDYSCQN